MPLTNISELDTTNMQAESHTSTTTPIYKTISNYDISPATMEIYKNNEETIYDQTRFSEWIGFYKNISELNAVINKKALWTIGKGFSAKEKIKKLLEKIKGNGKDTFDTIMNNNIITYTAGGDSFGEIITINN